MTANQLSEELLLIVKKEESTADLVAQLSVLPFNQLLQDLRLEGQKKAFWINLYNAFFLILRKEHQIEKPQIFREPLIHIAGHNFSLDDMEHGILRKHRFKWSLGYLQNPFASGLIKKLAVAKVDYRIHFALNCGAKSCPPIAFYTAERLEQQLEMATLSFLETETQVDKEKKEIHITRLFQWYNGDFGGSKGIHRILQEKLGLATKGMRLVYSTYNWEEALDNFK